MQIKHIFTCNVADGTNTNIVRPSNWNSSHLMTQATAVYVPLFPGDYISGTTNMSNSMSTIFFQPFVLPFPVTLTRVAFLNSMVTNITSGTSNTSYGATISRGAAFYSFNNTSLALYSSSSGDTTFSYTSRNYSSWVGIKNQTDAISVALSEGQWWFAMSFSSVAVRTNSTSGTVATTIANSYYQGNLSYLTGSGDWGDTDANTYFLPFFGYHAQSAAFPNSVAMSDLTSSVGRPIIVYGRGV